MITRSVLLSILQKVCKDMEIKKIRDDLPLRDQGADSLDMFNILLELENVSGKSIPDDDIEQLQSIDSIVKYFKSK